MKRYTITLVLLVCLMGSIAGAQTIQAGIFGIGANTVLVRAKVSSGTVTGVPFNNVVVTLFWETASGIVLGTPGSSFNINKAGGVGTEGTFSYQKFAGGNDAMVNWATGQEIDLFTVTMTSGTGPALIEVRNPADGSVNGDWYIELAGVDRTDYGSPFYVSSTELALPVTLTSFAGRIGENGSGVLLEWATASEVNNYGYTVQRKLEQEQTFVDLPDAFIPGHGTTVEAQSYSFHDNTVSQAGRYAYRLKQQDLDGAVQFSQSVVVTVAVTAVVEQAPREFQLMQNYPNPFNPATMVKFSVPSTGRASLKVYTMVGQEVTTLYEGVAEAGRYYAVPFNAANLASGVYFYRLVTEQKTDVRRMMLLK